MKSLIGPGGQEIPIQEQPGGDDQAFNHVLVNQARRFVFEGAALWEEQLRLVLRPRPWWCLPFIYALAVRLVLRQEQARKVFHQNITRRRRWGMFRPASCRDGGRSFS